MVGYPSNVLIIADYPNYRFKEQIKYRVDFVLSCGDVPYQVLEDVHERYGKPIYAVIPNHDPSGPFPGFVRNVHYAVTQERNCVIGGWEGVPSYKPSGRGMFDDYEASQFLAQFPRMDIFLAHAPVYGKTDLPGDYFHIGSQAILRYIEEKRPSFIFHGHIHKPVEAVVGETFVRSIHGFQVVILEKGDGGNGKVACRDPSVSVHRLLR